MLTPRFSRNQRGITLIESLIAILIMAVGILGIMGVQMRTLNDTQTGVRRAQAIRLIEDLSERLKVNPNGLNNIDGYLLAWKETPTEKRDCSKNECSNAQLADYDRAMWRKSVSQVLPGGDATVFLAKGETDVNNRRQLGVMLSWRQNEKAPQTDTAYLSPIDVSTGADVTCPDGSTCHLQYIPVSARCAPDFASGNPLYYCGGKVTP